MLISSSKQAQKFGGGCTKILAIDQASRHSAFSIGVNGKLTDYGELNANGEGDDRIYEMAVLIKKKIKQVKPDVVYFENIQLQAGNVSVYQMLARLQGELIFMFKEMGLPYKIVAPVTWKANIGICKGKRDVQKQACIELMQERYGLDLFGNDDIADSLGILTYAIENEKEILT